MSIFIDPTKWHRETTRIALTPGTYWCVKKDTGDTFAINASIGTQFDIERCDYYGPVQFLPPKKIPPKPEFKPVLIELLKDCHAGMEGDILWAVKDQSGVFWQFEGTRILGQGIGKGFCKVMP